MPNDPNGLEKELLEYVRQRVRKEFKANGHHRCRFDALDDQDVRAIAHAIESARNLGSGSLSKALSTYSENHRWIAAQRHKYEYIQKLVIRGLILGLATGVLTALWVGIKQLAAQ